MNKEYMIIDGMPVPLDGEKNILQVIRKAGIELPTFCYYSELSVYGACRMCVVEDKWGSMNASCSTPPKNGMEIKTNTPKLQKHRKMILELLLSNHCRDCTTCEKNGHCKLRDLALRFRIDRVRFDNKMDKPMLDTSSLAIVRDQSKCILCGDCVRMCSEIQNVGAIDFAYRGSKMIVSPSFEVPIANTNCVDCGQCASVCPTGAIVVKNDVSQVWKELYAEDVQVVVQVAPAVRVALGDEFKLSKGENVMGKIVAAMKRLGFDEVYDTATAADLTVLEETREFLNKLENEKELPLFTSCCPAWVKYAERNHPDLIQNISTCRSPMQMFGSVIKEHCTEAHLAEGKRTVVVAVMPCTAKKAEADRDEFKKDGEPYVDYVITTQELAQMIKEAGILFDELEPEATDMPFGMATGAGIIFGVTGGVTEAVIRRIMEDKGKQTLSNIAYSGVRGFDGLKAAKVVVDNREIHIAIVSGLSNAENLIQKIKSGEAKYDFIEVMACPGGCICGAGQPFTPGRGRQERSKGIYEADRMSNMKRAEENPVVMSLYSGVLKGKTHKLLHVNYSKKNDTHQDKAFDAPSYHKVGGDSHED